MVDTFPSSEDVAEELASDDFIELQLTPYQAFTLVGYLQLSFRHPAVLEMTTAGMMRAIAAGVQQVLVDRFPTTKPILQAGWLEAFDVDMNVDYCGNLTDESTLRVIFSDGVVPIQHPFSFSNELIGPHYVLDAKRISPEQFEALVAVAVDAWDEPQTEGTLQSIREQITKGLPLKLEHFTPEISGLPNAGGDQ
jgi:hypothetical protein